MSRLPHPLAIYIHWPFCARICSYCDFVKYKAPSWLTRNYDQSTSNPTQTATGNYTVTRDQVGFDKILATYQKDIFRHSSKLSQSSQPSWRVSSIFFGGGTPSLAPPAFVEQLLSFIHQRFDVDPGAEVIDKFSYQLSQPFRPRCLKGDVGSKPHIPLHQQD